MTLRGAALFLVLAALASPAWAGKLLDRSADGYLVSLPRNFEPGSKAPILVIFPGNTVSAKAELPMWQFAADKSGFVLVACDMSYERSSATGEAAEITERAYRRAKSALAAVADEFGLDPGDVVLAGTSAGGMVSMAAAFAHPGEFRAVGVMAGARTSYIRPETLRGARGQKVFLLHGSADPLLGLDEFRRTKALLEQNGADVTGQVVPKGGHALPSSAYASMVQWLRRQAGKSAPSASAGGGVEFVDG